MLLGIAGADLSIDPNDARASLGFFCHNPANNQEIKTLIDDLDADAFEVRDKAFEKLTHLPALPVFVRRMAKEETKPEVRTRLEDLANRFTVEYESAGLNRLLHQINTARSKGALAPMVSIVQSGRWQIDPGSLHQAARATVTPDDLPLIEAKLANKSADVRSLIAAALAGLPVRVASGPLQQLLHDPAEQVRLSAALSLARLRHKACLPAFARLLESPDFFTRHQSWSALKALSGQDFGFDPSEAPPRQDKAAARWKRWSSGNKAGIRGELPENLIVGLFNGRNLAGWDVYENGRPVDKQQTGWSVVDRQLVCLGGIRGDIRTQQRFENYVLTLDFKIDKPDGDSGVGILFTQENEAAGANEGKYLEVQLLPGACGDLYAIGGFHARANGKAITFSAPRTAPVDDPPGKWHQLKLSVTKGSVKVRINGALVNEATGGSKGPGKIVIRNEGKRISFRNIMLSRAGK